MNVDPEIVTLTLIIGATVMSGGLFGLTRGYLGQVRGVSRWAAATLMQALGWTLIGPLRGVVPDLISIVLGYGLLTLPQAIYLIVVAEFTGARIRAPWVYGTVVVQSIALAYFTVASPTAIGRMATVTTCTAILMLKSSHVLVTSAERRRPGHRFTALLFAACGVVMLASDLCLLDWGPDLNRASMPLLAFMNDVSYAVFFVTTTLLSFGFVLMVSDRYIVLQEQATAALSKSEAQQRAITQSAYDAIITADSAGTIVGWNRGATLEFGYEESEALGRPLTQLVPERYRDRHLAGMGRMRSGGELRLLGKTLELDGRRKDGTEFPIAVTLSRWESAEGAFVTAIIGDITERRQAEDRMRESEARFKTLFTQAPFGSAMIDSLTGQIHEVNPRFAEIAGRTLEELRNIDWMQITHPDDVQKDLDNMARLNAGATDGFRMEKRYLRPDGSPVWVDMAIARLKVKDKAHPLHLCMIQDITERKRVEEALRESKDLLQSVIEHVPTRIFWKGRDLRYLGANTQFAIAAGYKHPDELIGRTDSEMAWKNQAESYRADDQAVMESGLPMLDYEQPARTTTGADIRLSTSKVPLRGEQNQIVGVLGLDQDITERKRVEEALRDSLNEKEVLLKETHHRVKNNLALIASLMRLEAGRSREPATKATLNDMQTRIRTVVLLNETLYRTASYAKVKLADYLKQIAAQVFQAQNADAEAIRLVLDLEPVEVETAQAIPCGLIVNELLTNSLKHAFNFGGRGEVRVSLRSGAHGQVRLCVSDTGAGLPEDFASNRSDSLGMQLVSDLARQLMGDLEIGPGSAFTVTFTPRRRAETTEIPSPPDGPAAKAGPGLPEPSPPPPTIGG